MTITDYLKMEGSIARVSDGDNWLVYDEALQEWVVYQRKYAAKRTKVLISTPDEEKAVLMLSQG